MGLDFEFVNGEGPVVHQPIRTLEQIQALRTDRTEDLRYVSHAIEKVAKHFSTPREDGDHLGIIGFIGAPFTLASYMIEGASSRNYIETKKLMYASGISNYRHSDPERSEGEEPPYFARSATDLNVGSKAWPLLMDKLVTVLTEYAAQQVEAGADVIQIFDSWAGALSVSDYRDYCLAPTTELVRRVQALGVPVIYFGVDTASLLPTMRETGADVLGLDWRIPLDQAWSTLNYRVAVQGNLDPITLFAPQEVIHARTQEILAAAAGRPGHIFNLGHGIVPGTPVENVIQLVKWVKQYSHP
jgi:uroporphyrinogen decarboxylase